ncbi:hypothetical protein [Glutamicibacter sp. NPDC087344]|uniref:hypothetical protein n=1 Tax=Glutamicibacter sp. NPDC087344 TaxID=3363994 RepID=UPI0037FD7C84
MNKTLERTGAAPCNFEQHSSSPDSELVQQMAKDPYALEFLGLTREVAEREPFRNGTAPGEVRAEERVIAGHNPLYPVQGQ